MSSGGERAWVVAALARYERPLLRYVASLAGADQAADVVQESFLELCKQDPAALEGRVGPWLFVVARNKALDALRRSTRMSDTRTEAIQDDREGPEEALERKQALARLRGVLEGLDERHREVVRLRFAGGLSYQEIAAITELTVSNVGFILHTALKHVRERLAHAPRAQVRVQQEPARSLS